MFDNWAVPLLADETRTPSIRISVWLLLAPRMNRVVLAPRPPLAANSTPACVRRSERRSMACELMMSCWVTTVVCGSASVSGWAVRLALTTTGASCASAAGCTAEASLAWAIAAPGAHTASKAIRVAGSCREWIAGAVWRAGDAGRLDL